jgi:hypothetical protein
MSPGRWSLTLAANLARMVIHEIAADPRRGTPPEEPRPARMLFYSRGAASQTPREH